ncbi:MAG: ribonuclease III [Clostridiales bacterium]|nr:ribonuclease III [Clostridiales bacterium]MCD7827738.1 ribonuclease III [Clostridiales bacterium]
MSVFEQIIGYEFKDKELLNTALTHSSYANEMQNKVKFNERLEFLGDSVLGMITAEYFFKNHPEMPEGQLTKLRASMVCEKSLYRFAQTIKLGEFLNLGRGEIHSGGRNRPSILADAFEALIAAIYLDAGFDEAKKFVLGFIANAAVEDNEIDDYKSALQEIIQKNHGEILEYFMAGESGPDHDKTFTVEVHLNSNVIGVGQGHSKKKAEQMAAKEALRLMGIKL